jgi:C1A family cysteine protease
MRSTLLALCAALFFCSASALASHEQHDPLTGVFAAWMSTHSKSYSNEEFVFRWNVWRENHRFIEEHNRQNHTYHLAMNQFGDLTIDEFQTRHTSKMGLAFDHYSAAPPVLKEKRAAFDVAAPASVDWRKEGVVTPAKNQGALPPSFLPILYLCFFPGACDSSYAFGTVSVIESAIALKTGQLLDLSEQQVVDCSINYEQGMNGGCNGGHEVVVMDYVSARGITTEASYPYTSNTTQQHGRCRIGTGTNARGLKMRRIAPLNENKLAEGVAVYGPLVASVSAENRDFLLYRGGIYENKSCPKAVDHVVSVVGYGTENGKPYWIIKNSWGSTWGENGFMKLARGVNMCGIVSDNAWSIYF